MEKEYAQIQRRNDEQLRIAARQYQGHHFVDLRLHYKDDSGEWKPTKKGVTIRPDQIAEVIEALKAAQVDLAEKE